MESEGTYLECRPRARASHARAPPCKHVINYCRSVAPLIVSLVLKSSSLLKLFIPPHILNLNGSFLFIMLLCCMLMCEYESDSYTRHRENSKSMTMNMIKENFPLRLRQTNKFTPRSPSFHDSFKLSDTQQANIVMQQVQRERERELLFGLWGGLYAGLDGRWNAFCIVIMSGLERAASCSNELRRKTSTAIKGSFHSLSFDWCSLI